MDTQLNRSWTVYLVHHTHTDIGYTETQSRITNYHLDYLDQVVDFHENSPQSDTPFKWTNECFWTMEKWLQSRGESGRARIAKAISEGTIGLSSTYLHFSELINEASLRSALRRANDFACSIGSSCDSALSADINGYGWGYSQALYDSGVRNLLTCVHSHHGLAPIGRRQYPFYWETPNGDELLVWNGEVYIFGNELGLVPGAMTSSVISDEWRPQPATPWSRFIAERRLPRYLKQLEEDEYPFDFVIVHASGAMTDNAPPNFRIPAFFDEWNADHGDKIRLKMATISEAAQAIRRSGVPIPRYRGDWPDWWSDGFTSMPTETRFIREAGRGLARLRALRSKCGSMLSPETESQIENDIIMFCEHTFHHSDSMKMPWDGLGKLIGSCKRTMAAAALDGVIEGELQAARSLGGTPQMASRPLQYTFVNPYDHSINDIVRCHLDRLDFDTIQLAHIVRDESGNAVANVEKCVAPRGYCLEMALELAPGESRTFDLSAGLPTPRCHIKSIVDGTLLTAAPGELDVAGAGEVREFGYTKESGHHKIRTAFCEIEISQEEGIVGWKDTESRTPLLADQRLFAPFTVIYEHTPVVPSNDGEAQVRTRASFGRNRKGADVQRAVSQITGIKKISDHSLFTSVRIDQSVKGCSFLQTELKVWKHRPLVEVSVRMNKDSVWDPENMYIAMPFAPQGNEPAEIFLAKAGAVITPVEDQLPDTLTDWYCLQSGYGVCGNRIGIAVCMLDAPLLQLGPLDFEVRHLAGYPGLKREAKDAFGWLMTNYWETNFEASLGGFYEFNYRIQWGTDLASAGSVMRACRELENRLFALRTSK